MQKDQIKFQKIFKFFCGKNQKLVCEFGANSEKKSTYVTHVRALRPYWIWNFSKLKNSRGGATFLINSSLNREWLAQMPMHLLRKNRRSTSFKKIERLNSAHNDEHWLTSHTNPTSHPLFDLILLKIWSSRSYFLYFL